MPPAKWLLIPALTLILTLSVAGSTKAAPPEKQNDFVKDVNEGKADLAANPAAQKDVREAAGNEVETADDEDGTEVEDKDVQDSAEAAEPATSDESATDDNTQGNSDKAGNQ